MLSDRVGGDAKVDNEFLEQVKHKQLNYNFISGERICFSVDGGG